MISSIWFQCRGFREGLRRSVITGNYKEGEGGEGGGGRDGGGGRRGGESIIHQYTYNITYVATIQSTNVSTQETHTLCT